MKVIDFEHHSYPVEYLEFLATRKTAPRYDPVIKGLYYKDTSGTFANPCSFNNSGMSMIDELVDYDNVRIADLDKFGVTCAMVSSGHTVEELPRDDCIRMVQLMNNRIAEAVKRHPDRYIGAFCLPTPYVDAAVEEIYRAVNELGLKMWQTHSNYGQEALYMEKFEPILAKCAELNVPFYVHPNSPDTPYLLGYGTCISGAPLGFGVDVMNTTMRIILNGTFDRYPNLKMIIGHMGEYYPYSIDRIDNRLFPDPHHKLKHNFRYYFENKNVLFTTSGVFSVPVFMCAKDVIGIENILFGSDYPYEDLKRGVDFIKSLPITDEEKEMVFHGNAEKYIL